MLYPNKRKYFYNADENVEESTYHETFCLNQMLYMCVMLTFPISNMILTRNFANVYDDIFAI